MIWYTQSLCSTDLIDLAGYIIAHAGFVQQKGNVVARGNHQWQLLSGRGTAPEFGVAIARIGKNGARRLTVLQGTIDKEFAQGGGSFLKERREKKYVECNEKKRKYIDCNLDKI